MKKTIACMTILGICLACGGKKAYAWNGVTHEDITKKALALLEKENKKKAAQFYKNWHKQIITGCKQPDNKDDPDSGTGMHYYSCINSKGLELPKYNNYYVNRLGKAMKSARTLFEENYTCALSLYKSGDIENAMLYIGRAAHFIEDMGCTVHTANMKYLDTKNNIHFAFEKNSSQICSQITADRFDKRLIKNYEQHNMGDAVNKLVNYAGRFTDMLCDLKADGFRKVAKQTLPYTQQNVMALLLRFYSDCCEDKDNFLENEKKYSIINLGSKLFVTATPKGIVLAPETNDESQKFQVCLTKTGTFGLKDFSGGFINKKCKGCDYVKIGTEPAQFRAAAAAPQIFRLSTEKTDFEKVLTASRGGLGIADFEPGNNSQLWIIK